ncbi:hypothetical protein D915_007436 [Fasciola hepatica]|uniref:Uncharacterized protein n=1 Tax=Fasciola hepatica TaxID=6192 RepID=A0A4E0RYL9_FASHE|nr:hypothetical protein D915_007436 [Fasciola hepatica]
MFSTTFAWVPMELMFILGQVLSETLTTSVLPNPRYSPSLCGLTRPGFICDLNRTLSESARASLHQFLETRPRDTPCFCGKPCSPDQIGLSRRLIIGVLILGALPRTNMSAVDYAEYARSTWVLGSCPGNDVLMLAMGSKIYIAYGSLVSRALTPDCIRSLPSTYDVKMSVNRTIQHLAGILQQFFVNPCMCRSCKNAYSWFKIPAMLLACFCLLMWLSLVGRRAYLRRVHLPVVRGAACCSLTDLDYLGNNLDYVVRLPPRAFARSRLSQSRRVLLSSPSRSAARGTHVTQNSPQRDDSLRSSSLSADSALRRLRSPSPPPPSYASLIKSSPVPGLLSPQEDPKITAADSNMVSVEQYFVDSVNQESKPPTYSDVLALSQLGIQTSPCPSGESHVEETKPCSSSHSAIKTQTDA